LIAQRLWQPALVSQLSTKAFSFFVRIIALLFVERLQIDRTPLWERFSPQEMDEYIEKGKLPAWAIKQHDSTAIQ
jgi:hypothetical protein